MYYYVVMGKSFATLPRDLILYRTMQTCVPEEKGLLKTL